MLTVLCANTGVYSAFNNPHLRDTLSNMGLQQDTAFACLFDFLYRPAPEVSQGVEDCGVLRI